MTGKSLFTSNLAKVKQDHADVSHARFVVSKANAGSVENLMIRACSILCWWSTLLCMTFQKRDYCLKCKHDTVHGAYRTDQDTKGFGDPQARRPSEITV